MLAPDGKCSVCPSKGKPLSAILLKFDHTTFLQPSNSVPPAEVAQGQGDRSEVGRQRRVLPPVLHEPFGGDQGHLARVEEDFDQDCQRAPGGQRMSSNILGLHFFSFVAFVPSLMLNLPLFKSNFFISNSTNTSGAAVVAQHTPRDREIVGSNPTECSAFFLLSILSEVHP